MSEELKPWRCEFQYGPDGEATYAWVRDEKGSMVGTFKLVHALAIVNAANTSNTIIEEQAKELYLLRNENSNLRDNVGEQASRIEELQAALDSDPDGSGFWRFWSKKAIEQVEKSAAYQARLSEAVKVLERVMAVVTYPCDTSIQARGYGVRSIDVSGCEYIAEAIEAFITTLGGENVR